MLSGGQVQILQSLLMEESRIRCKNFGKMTGRVGTEHLHRVEHLSADLEKLGAKVFLRLPVRSLDKLPQKAFHKSHCQAPRAYLPEFLPVELLLHSCPTGPFCQSQ